MYLSRDEQLTMEYRAFALGLEIVYNTVNLNPKFKSIPIDQLASLRAELKTMGYKFRTRYRGPRYDCYRAFTRKEDAKAFTLYFI